MDAELIPLMYDNSGYSFEFLMRNTKYGISNKKCYMKKYAKFLQIHLKCFHISFKLKKKIFAKLFLGRFVRTIGSEKFLRKKYI